MKTEQELFKDYIFENQTENMVRTTKTNKTTETVFSYLDYKKENSLELTSDFNILQISYIEKNDDKYFQFSFEYDDFNEHSNYVNVGIENFTLKEFLEEVLYSIRESFGIDDDDYLDNQAIEWLNSDNYGSFLIEYMNFLEKDFLRYKLDKQLNVNNNNLKKVSKI